MGANALTHCYCMYMDPSDGDLRVQHKLDAGILRMADGTSFPEITAPWQKPGLQLDADAESESEYTASSHIRLIRCCSGHFSMIEGSIIMRACWDGSQMA